MANTAITTVGANGHSTGSEVVVGNIGKAGTVFSGTFTGRVAAYSWDFILNVYTEKDARLYVIFVAGETTLTLTRTAINTFVLLSGGTQLGTFKYNSETGDLSVTAPSTASWFQGTLMGMVAAVAA